jgi:hypothetical protein
MRALSLAIQIAFAVFALAVSAVALNIAYANPPAKEDFHPTRFTPGIRILDHPGPRRRVIEECRAADAPTRVDYPGCALVRLAENTCDIYYLDGISDGALDIQAHERTHCWFGKWHDKPEGA